MNAARIAAVAAAPDLVRALLAVEWVEVVASHGEEPGWECPQCSRFYSGKERPINKPHFGSCALDAALRKDQLLRMVMR